VVGKRQRLATKPLFEGCRGIQLTRLVHAFDDVRIDAGSVVVRQGRADHWLYVVDQGYAQVVVHGRVVRTIGPGDWFGGAVRPVFEPEPETIRAATDLVVFVVGRQRLPPLLDRVPPLRRRLPAPARRGGPARRDGYVPARRPRPTAAPGLTEYARRFQAAGPPAPARRPVPRNRRARRAFVAGLATSVAAFVLLYHPPVAVIEGGQPIDITADITISGVPSQPTTGRYLLTWVRVERPTLVGLAGRMIGGGTGHLVWSFQPDPAAQLAARQDFEEAERLASLAAQRATGLQFRARFRPRGIGGPSAGLVYALAITDMVSPADLARGRDVAATGTIGADGKVGEVGGVWWKAASVRRTSADLFLVPTTQARDAAGAGGRARGVDDLADAVAVLLGR
jgi:CRP-like cAMP-binding protein